MILDTRTYQVKFSVGEVTEITTNAIAELMYAQHTSDRNEYLLLDVLVDYQKDNKAVSLTDQKNSTGQTSKLYHHCRLAY